MMRWFGLPRGYLFEEDTPHTEAPLDAHCAWCAEEIDSEDGYGFLIDAVGMDRKPRRIAYHYECQVRLMCGGLNHLRGNCTCQGGTEPPDPPGISLREAACLAVAFYQGSRPAWPADEP